MFPFGLGLDRGQLGGRVLHDGHDRNDRARIVGDVEAYAVQYVESEPDRGDGLPQPGGADLLSHDVASIHDRQNRNVGGLLL